MIRVSSKGDYKKVSNYLTKLKKKFNIKDLEKYGEQGVIALMNSTPVDTGKTRDSWYYKITESENQVSIQFCNSNIVNYVPIAIILQYGHATGSGGWVQGRDYINPAVRPVFDTITNAAWKEVISE